MPTVLVYTYVSSPTAITQFFRKYLKPSFSPGILTSHHLLRRILLLVGWLDLLAKKSRTLTAWILWVWFEDFLAPFVLVINNAACRSTHPAATVVMYCCTDFRISGKIATNICRLLYIPVCSSECPFTSISYWTSVIDLAWPMPPRSLTLLPILCLFYL